MENKRWGLEGKRRGAKPLQGTDFLLSARPIKTLIGHRARVRWDKGTGPLPRQKAFSSQRTTIVHLKEPDNFKCIRVKRRTMEKVCFRVDRWETGMWTGARQWQRAHWRILLVWLICRRKTTPRHAGSVSLITISVWLCSPFFPFLFNKHLYFIFSDLSKSTIAAGNYLEESKLFFFLFFFSK